LNPTESNSQYFKRYRSLLGFASQDSAKKFLGAKDLVAPVSVDYASSLVSRVAEIIDRLDGAVWGGGYSGNLDLFKENSIQAPYKLILENNLLPRLNNQGRRPEHVLFSWLRGYATAEYFLGPLSSIFGCGEFASIGQDDFTSYETFRRAPTADYSAVINGTQVRLEIQSGFQSISDIKQHKVLEAKSIRREAGDITICVHLDMFNGQCAFVRLDTIEDDDINCGSRQQMEGQTVFCIG